MLVVKIGGSLVLESLSPLFSDIRDLWSRGEDLIVVHGGGRLVTVEAEKIGVKQKFYRNPSGFTTRLTDSETIKVFKMVVGGLLNKDLVVKLLKVGVPAIGLSGVDCTLVKGERKKRILVIDERGRKRFIYGDYSGRPVKVNSDLLQLFLEKRLIPVIAPIGVDEEFNIINMDGDRVAALIAKSLGSERLVYLTDVDGVMLNGELVERLSLEEAESAMRLVSGGMRRKLLASIEALKGGVGEVIIASGLRENPLKNALSRKKCTVVVGYA
ncbi:MAG: acetylaminoadipate kinase [Thermoprotei archaeon]|nr:MAG: acetylaminoadipate kinase [Thermoprotei archaeon]